MGTKLALHAHQGGINVRKWLFSAFLALSLFGIAGIAAVDWSPVIRVNLYPASVYMDGMEIRSGERKGHFYNGTSYVPAAIEYQGTMYVPLRLVGNHLNKQVGWDEQTKTVWLGERPTAIAGQQESPASKTTANAAEQKPADEKPGLFGVSLGAAEQQVLAALGQPARRDASPLGYEWWIYNRDFNRYVQVGLMNGKVVDLYSNAPFAKVGNVSVGTSYQSLSRHHPLNQVVSFRHMGAQIQITNQTKERPLAIANETPLIFYLDKHNHDKVTALRLIDKLILLRGGFYETKWTYQGKAPEFDPPALSVKQREAVNAAHERQILDLVNVIRHRYNLAPLSWNNQAAAAARKHSIDMENNKFFDHVSATTGLGPFERLKQAGISYRLAGENIAAGFPDAVEAHESWMNSPGHRKNILEKGFTQLGVGVHQDYYTQNFVTLQNDGQQ
jgi:uncharacterized protein YkwD